MANITSIFKAAIKDVKARNKMLGEPISSSKSLLTLKKKTQFSKRAADVVKHIAKLEEFLVSHRKDYINAGGILGSGGSEMTDAERDQIDSDAETFMKTCHEAIQQLKYDTSRERMSPQLGEHRSAVLSSINAYLKDVCKTYSIQRAIRVKRVIDRKKISRLERESMKSKKTFVSQLEGKTANSDAQKNKQANDYKPGNTKSEEKRTEKRVPALFQDDHDFTPEEAAELEQENAQLYQEMNSMVDEVKQIEGKVVEISRLQEFFADKVIEQDRDIDRLGDTVVGSVENIKDANDEIREAMRNNAGLRVWILFFLIVLSCSLLFLDWYNP